MGSSPRGWMPRSNYNRGHQGLRPAPPPGIPSFVSLLALLAALAAQYAYPPPDRQWMNRLFGRLALSTAKRLNAGDRNSGILAWFVLMAIVLVPVAVVA